MVGLIMDQTAREYYRIVGFYEHSEEEEQGTYGEHYKKPFSDPEDNVDRMVQHWYDFVFRDCTESTKQVQSFSHRHRSGAKYIRENSALALISTESFVRKMAYLLEQNKEIEIL